MDHDHPAPPADVAVFRTFYEAHLGAVFRFIYSRVGNREEAEDLTAQVFTKALRGIDWSREEAALVGWLFQVARTSLADHWRQVSRIRTASLDDLLAIGWDAASVERTGEVPENLVPTKRVAAILLALPPNYREVLRYRFLLNYSIKETAQQLGLSEANVKVLQLRALRRAAQLHQDIAAPADVTIPKEVERHG